MTPQESSSGAGDSVVPQSGDSKTGDQKDSAEDKDMQNNDGIIVSENEDEKDASDADEDFVVGASKSKGKSKK